MSDYFPEPEAVLPLFRSCGQETTNAASVMGDAGSMPAGGLDDDRGRGPRQSGE